MVEVYSTSVLRTLCACTDAGLDKCHVLSAAVSLASRRGVDIATASVETLTGLLECGVDYDDDDAVAGLRRRAAGTGFHRSRCVLQSRS